MAVRPTDPEAMHLFQLIGAPMLAVIQAEAQAAQTSAEFIRRMGFEAPAAEGPVKTLQQGGDLGALKAAEFRIDRYAPDGTLQPHVVRVPVLSLLPIPMLQVKDAQIDFDIRVLSRVPLGEHHDDVHDPAFSASPDFLAPDRVELKGFLTSSPPGEATNQASIRMSVRVEQSDMPAGLMHVMKLMGESVSAAPLALVEQEGGRAKLSPPAGPQREEPR